jgi:hypothetical protein
MSLLENNKGGGYQSAASFKNKIYVVGVQK